MKLSRKEIIQRLVIMKSYAIGTDYEVLNKVIEDEKKLDKIEQIYSDYLAYMNPDNLADRLGEIM